MKRNKDMYAQVDREGRLVLPPEFSSRFGIKQGVRIRIDDEGTNGLCLRCPTYLAKLYVEPTTLCNLECRTCIRNVWNEPLGNMSDEVFDRVIEGLHAFSPPPTIFFGGFGEPLLHPKIVKMVDRAKSLGAPVELITNGTLLTAALSRKLISAGIDVLWVSIDGATQDSYTNIRLGASLPQVLENIVSFRDAGRTLERTPQLGISFVVTKHNIADLPGVLYLGWQLHAEHFLVTNVLPYTNEMKTEALYWWRPLLEDEIEPRLSLTTIDKNETTRAVRGPTDAMKVKEPELVDALRASLHWAMRGGMNNVTWAGINNVNGIRSVSNRCPFVESGAGAIGWDGNFSPCLPLLHSHVSFLDNLDISGRFSRRWAIGNVAERSLTDLWNTPEHIAFRERVLAFDFPPCTQCGGCDVSCANEKDCLGNVFPTCGGCLWAQGLIRCP